MTKTQRASSYLRHMAHQYDSRLPLLKPLRILTRRWGTTPLHDRATETTLPAQRPSVKTGAIPLLQASAPLSSQHAAELPPAHPPQKTAQPARGQEVTSPSSIPTQPASLHAPVALPGNSPVTEETTSEVWKPEMDIQLAPAKPARMSSPPVTEKSAPGSRKQQPQVDIQLAPAKPVHSLAAETSRPSNTMHVTSDRQTASKEKTVTLRPRLQQEAPAITPTNSRPTVDFLGQKSKASARAAEPQSRPAPHRQETQQQHAAIHIGTIDIHIVPPTPAVPLPPTQSTMARPRSTSALSREMTSFIGLRQG